MSEQTVKRGDELAFLTVRLPALRSLSYHPELTAHVEIVRGGIVAKKAGPQQVTVDLNSDGIGSDLRTFLQSDVNRLKEPSACSNPFNDFSYTHGQTIFTADKTDEEIQAEADKWVNKVLECYNKEVKLMSENLAILTASAR
tara:strand:+ start:629 stop:1054 length:426 start_codon:yes stop_codon:yes gene_type:complete